MRNFVLAAWAIPCALAQSYYFTSSEADHKIYQNRPFQLTYVPANGVSVTSLAWSTPNTCTGAPGATPATLTVTLTCSQIATTPLQITANANSGSILTIPLIVLPHYDCFQWYLITAQSLSLNTAVASHVLEPNTVEVNEEYEARLWIVDPTQMSATELTHSALSPSTESLAITNAFYSAGESPILDFPSQESLNIVNSPLFDSTNGYWKFNFSSTSTGGVLVSISDMGSSVYGCQISDSLEIVSIVKNSSLTDLGFLKVSSVTASGSNPFVIEKEACSPLSIYALTSVYGPNTFLHSSKSTSPTSSDKFYTLNPSAAILDLKTVYNGVIVLGSNNQLYINSGTLTTPSVIAASGLTMNRLATASACAHSNLVDHSFATQFVATWNDASTTLQSFVSFDAGSTFKALSVSTSITTATIKSITVDASSKSLVYALLNSGNCLTFVYKLADDLTGTWVTGSTIAGSSCNLIAAPGAGSNVLLYTTQSLHLSQNSGKNFFKLKFVDQSGIWFSSFTSETISRISFYSSDALDGLDKKFIVVTSLANVYYGKIGVSYIVQVPIAINKTRTNFIDFDIYGNIQVSYPNADGSFDKDYTNIDYVEKLLFSTNTCIYKEFNVNSTSPEIILDTNDTLSIQIDGYFQSNTKSSQLLSVSLTNTSLFTFQKNTSIVAQSETQVLQISGANYTGRCDMSISTVSADWGCPTITKTTALYSGCPPDKRIVFRGESVTPGTSIYASVSTACANYTTTATVPGQNATVAFDCLTMGGPPLEVYYNYRFKPAFDLYDGDKFIAPVDVDFVLKEVYYRPETFSYSLKVKDAGCRVPPQTWEQFDYNFSLWNSSNYQACYNSASTSSLDAVNYHDYQIINSTSNTIAWKDSRERIYVFKAKVLNPDYSFCQLETTFAVHLYGVPMEVPLQLAILLSAIGVMLLVLGFSYYKFSSQMMKEREEMKQKLKKD